MVCVNGIGGGGEWVGRGRLNSEFRNSANTRATPGIETKHYPMEEMLSIKYYIIYIFDSNKYIIRRRKRKEEKKRKIFVSRFPFILYYR